MKAGTVGKCARATRCRTGRAARAWALVLPALLCWAGCAAFEHGESLVPTRHHLQTGPFLLHSNFPIDEEAPAVLCLRSLQRDVEQWTAFRATEGDGPVDIYVLENRDAFEHFLRFHYPELPSRRAFFLAQDGQRTIYTYSSSRLDEDLRHEATHALMRGAFGDLPLWLDEGLAEFFENDLSQPETTRARLDQIEDDLRGGWRPNLARLEAMTDIHEMSQRDYREAWGWAHLLLDGPEDGKAILLGYLEDADHPNDRPRLGPRLAGAQITNDRLLEHLRSLPRARAYDAAAVKASTRPKPIRARDGPARAAKESHTRAPGPWRRLKALLGLWPASKPTSRPGPAP